MHRHDDLNNTQQHVPIFTGDIPPAFVRCLCCHMTKLREHDLRPPKQNTAGNQQQQKKKCAALLALAHRVPLSQLEEVSCAEYDRPRN